MTHSRDLNSTSCHIPFFVKSDYVPVLAIYNLSVESPTMHLKRPVRCDIDLANCVFTLAFCLPLLLRFPEIRSFAIVDYGKRIAVG